MDFFGLGYFVIEEDQNFEMAKHIFNYGNMKFAITTKKKHKKKRCQLNSLHIWPKMNPILYSYEPRNHKRDNY